MADTDRVAYGKNLCVTSSKLYNNYYSWCEDNALTALKRDTFISWVKQNEQKFNVKYSHNIPLDGKTVRGFRGITLKYMST